MPAVLKVSDLKKLSTFAPEGLRLQVGVMALIERPAAPLLQQAAMRAAAVTVPQTPNVAQQALSLMLGFAEMLVIPIGATAPEGNLTLGRGDCDVVIADPSASTLHAKLRWAAWDRSAWIEDLGSTNGTLVNGVVINAEKKLAEGDVISLGNAAFLFVTVDTLHAMMNSRA